MKHQDVPGTTFKKHLAIAHGLLSEDDYLLTEILFNPLTSRQLSGIQNKLSLLQEIVKEKNTAKMKTFLDGVRKNLE
jgi:prephenate dehydrogenase